MVYQIKEQSEFGLPTDRNEAGLGKSSVLRRKGNLAALDLAVQEVSVGSEEHRGGGKDPGQSNTSTAGMGAAAAGHSTACSRETR